MGMQRSYRVLMHSARAVHPLVPDGIDTCLGLPRLTPLEQTAPWVLGAFDLRGELVPVVSLGVLTGERTPPAAATDLVLVVLAAGFPLGLYSPRPVCIEPLPAPRQGLARGARRQIGIDLSRLRLTATDKVKGPDAETRLARFERRLSASALARLELRARRYGDFAGAPPPTTAAWSPAQQR